MMGGLQQHAYALRQALTRMGRAPVAYLFSVLVISLSLAMPIVLYRLVSDLGDLARAQAGPPQLTVFLRMDAGEALVSSTGRALQARSDLLGVRFVSPETALQEIRRTTRMDDVLAGLDGNPLPAAFVVRPRAGEPGALLQLQKSLQALPGVDLVQLDAEWARRLYALGQLSERGVLLLAAVLVAGLLSVVVNTLRLQILAAREEIEVCKLMGASNAFVRRPFVYFGVLQVLMGSLLAMGLAELARWSINQASTDWLVPLGLHLQLHAPDVLEWCSLLGWAVLMGWFASAATVAAFLRQLRGR